MKGFLQGGDKMLRTTKGDNSYCSVVVLNLSSSFNKFKNVEFLISASFKNASNDNT